MRAATSITIDTAGRRLVRAGCRPASSIRALLLVHCYCWQKAPLALILYEVTRVRCPLTDQHFQAQLAGFSLTTAEIFYRLPDYPALLQSFVWQEYDCAPRFPKLLDFLAFWSSNLDGKLYNVRVAHNRLIHPAEFRFIDGKFALN
jgi:uncharacterized protein Usg